MPRNFLIVYTAREGSSAIVARLSANPHVAVPVFEELDAFWIRRFYGRLDLAGTLDQAFATGQLDLPHMYGRKKFLADQPEAGSDLPRDARAVGFKWRPHGINRQVVEVLRRHDVLVLHLVRQDFVELVSSLYISEQRIGGRKVGHAQFKAAKNDAAREKMRAALDDLAVPARLLPVTAIAFRRVFRAAQHRRVLRRFAATGLETGALHYEDFNADGAGFIAALQTRLGVPAPTGETARPRAELQKVAGRPAKERVVGLDRQPLALVLGVLGALYARLIRPLPQRSELTGTQSVR